MDIRQEIDNHLNWIENIVSLLGRENLSDEELAEVTRHDRCALGQWLASTEASEFKELPELQALKESHDQFHRLAGDLIKAVEAGDEAQAVASEEKFVGMSREVIAHLQALQQSREDKAGG
ncbi:MAG: CZB domain-containing protein [Halieaceae bacterium]|nr:CZB domain-containing protein [Halieaceae bacterium]